MINFKSFPINKYSYNYIFIVVDQLSKQAFFILYYKTTIAKDIADLYDSRD